MIFREVAFGSDDYRRECVLRQLVLRAPLGLDLFAEDSQRCPPVCPPGPGSDLVGGIVLRTISPM